MNINLHFTEEDWERIERDWTAWWTGELDRPMVVLPRMDTLFSASQDEYTRDFLLERPIDEVLDYHQKLLESARFYGDAWPKWIPHPKPSSGLYASCATSPTHWEHSFVNIVGVGGQLFIRSAWYRLRKWKEYQNRGGSI